MSTSVVTLNGKLAHIEQLPEKKQKQAIISEAQNVVKELLDVIDAIDSSAQKAKKISDRIKQSNEAKMLSELKKQIKSNEMIKADLIGQLRGIKRLARKIDPELASQITNIKQIEQ